MEHGWSQKHLIRTIVTSATYQQSSAVDAGSCWSAIRATGCWRAGRASGPTPRSCATSRCRRRGLLNAQARRAERLPAGAAERAGLQLHLARLTGSRPKGPERYRRTLYGFRKRSMPDPVMSTFDAPNGDFACARRVRSNTPLAALTSLNEPIFVEAARALALRVLREGGHGRRRAGRLRVPALHRRERRRPTERDEMLDAAANRARQRLADGWLNAREVATGDAAKLPDAAGGRDAAGRRRLDARRRACC